MYFPNLFRFFFCDVIYCLHTDFACCLYLVKHVIMFYDTVGLCFMCFFQYYFIFGSYEVQHLHQCIGKIWQSVFPVWILKIMCKIWQSVFPVWILKIMCKIWQSVFPVWILRIICKILQSVFPTSILTIICKRQCISSLNTKNNMQNLTVYF